MKIIIPTLADLSSAAKEFISATEGYPVVAFDAPMGAGKTTFIGEVCRQLGVTDDTTSPTFSIVNEYLSATTGETIYHFDCYRLEDEEEALDMGVEDYLESGRRCLIEWPEIIERFLPDNTLHATITEQEDGSRVVEIPEL